MKSCVALAAVAALAGAAGSARAVIVDLTAPMSSGVINGARFETVDFRSAGTGVIDSFVRIQRNETEQGYNTSGRPTAFDENTSGNFTRNLTYGEIPTRVISGVTYKEFMLDINQTNNNPLLSLDQVKIYTSAVGSQTTTNVDSLGALVYNMDLGGDSYVRMDYSLASGSGQGDVRLLVPASAFGAAGSGTFIYLYSIFGQNLATNDGFEEWAVQTDNVVVPLPPAATTGLASLIGIGALRVVRRRGR
jgi:hypothetical protein